METIAIQLTARQWATVDADMDNAAQSATDLGENNAPQMAIRQAGWDQMPWVGADRAWPPNEQLITIELTIAQWQMAISTLRAGDPVYEKLGDIESLDLGRDALRVISARLA